MNTFKNSLHSKIHYIQKFITFKNSLHSKIHYIQKFITFMHNILVLCILFIGLVLVIFLGLCANIYFNAPHVFLQNKDMLSSIEKVEKNINTGDILFFCGNTYGEKCIRYFTGCPFSHVALCVKEFDEEAQKNIIYLYECDLGQTAREGVRLIELRKKLKRGDLANIAAISKINIPLSLPKVLNIVQKNTSKDFDNLMGNYISFKLGFTNISDYLNDNNKKFCSQLIVELLRDINVFQSHVIGYHYSPSDFYNRKIVCNYPFNYKKPILVKLF